MDLADLTKYIVTNIVKEPEAVNVTTTEGNNETIINVTVSEGDIGAVIGRGGKTANAIRNVVQASAYINNLGRVRVNIDSK